MFMYGVLLASYLNEFDNHSIKNFMCKLWGYILRVYFFYPVTQLFAHFVRNLNTREM